MKFHRPRRVPWPCASLGSRSRHPWGADMGSHEDAMPVQTAPHPLPQPARMLRELGLTDDALSELFGIEFDRRNEP